jgi:hypothetical protein
MNGRFKNPSHGVAIAVRAKSDNTLIVRCSADEWVFVFKYSKAAREAELSKANGERGVLIVVFMSSGRGLGGARAM